MKIYSKRISLKALHEAAQTSASRERGGVKMAEMERLESEIVRLRVAEAAIRVSRENLENQLRLLVRAEAGEKVEAAEEVAAEAAEEEMVEEEQGEPEKVQPA